MFFELVSILFAIVPDYGNEYMTKENKHWTSFKKFAPKLNLNHNITLSFHYPLPNGQYHRSAVFLTSVFIKR